MTQVPSTDPAHVLIVDDEVQMTTVVAFALQTEGMRTTECHSGSAAWTALSRERIDLVILDLMLPDISGVTLCQRIRASSDVPIIMLTALGDTDKRLVGLEAGADDYIAKPFSPRELLLRARAVLRRSNRSRTVEDDLLWGPIQVERSTGRVWVGQQLLDLSEIELRLLTVLISRAGTVLSVQQLLNQVWGTAAAPGGRNMVKSTIYRLRRKLVAAGLPDDCVVTLRGHGYAMSPPPEA